MADIANSVVKSNFVAKSGPGKAGFSVKPSDNRFWTDIDGTQRPLSLDNVVLLTTTRAVLAKETGTKYILNSATAFTTTLPAVALGLEYWFFVKIAAGATGHTVAVTGTVKMYGKASPSGAALAATDAKGRTNTQATSVVGDGLHVWSDGTSWFADPTGTWAEQA